MVVVVVVEGRASLHKGKGRKRERIFHGRSSFGKPGENRYFDERWVNVASTTYLPTTFHPHA